MRYAGWTGASIPSSLHGPLHVILVCLALAACSAKPEHLLLAAKQGDLDQVLSLLDRGVPVTSTDRDGSTALHIAARWARTAVVKALIERHAPADATDREGRTPLHAAAMYGYEAIVRLLIEAGASAGSKDRQGLTPVDYARENGRSAVGMRVEDILSREAQS